MWLLHSRPDHAGSGQCCRRTRENGRGYSCIYEPKSLPLWRLSQDRGRHQTGTWPDGAELMRPFAFERAADLSPACRMGSATGQGQSDAPAQFLAGGTTLIDLMKLDVLRPKTVIDL